MKIGARLTEFWQHWTQRPRATLWASHAADAESNLNSQLFSAGQMEQHGKLLAASHRLDGGRAPDRLLARLAANENVLVGVSQLLTAAVTKRRRITPAGEWLLDNFYLIEEQIRTVRRHLPKGYSLELPRLAQGASAGRPRVYDIALEIIAHGDGHVDAASLSRFTAAYQTVTALNLGELWAIPIMLRLAVIENLRRVSAQIAASLAERNQAGYWADEMVETAETDALFLRDIQLDDAAAGYHARSLASLCESSDWEPFEAIDVLGRGFAVEIRVSRRMTNGQEVFVLNFYRPGEPLFARIDLPRISPPGTSRRWRHGGRAAHNACKLEAARDQASMLRIRSWLHSPKLENSCAMLVQVPPKGAQ